MPFMLAFAIIAIAVSAITYKTYVGYGEYPWYVKTAVLLILILAMSTPILVFLLHQKSDSFLALYTKPLYFLFGFVFILFIITFTRDIIWCVVDIIRHTPLEEMKNPPHLQKANIITLVGCLLFCFYGFYEAEKMPKILNYEIASPKIKKPTKVVMLSDLHIDIDTSAASVKKLVEKVNALNPDAIVLVGDTVDNKPKRLTEQMAELQKLKAPKGVFITLGNHEFYAGAFDWGIKFGQMGFMFLNNYGSRVGNNGVYIAGIPDINSAQMVKMPIKINNALYLVEDDFVIMLSHAPKIAEGINKDNVDLQLSAHTHGGQIYPFHYLVKQNNNGHIAGFYDVDGVKMYVSRGTRYWGPPMRIFAPSEITVFNLVPQKDDKSDK